jgi:hypothetical protein
MLKLIRASNFCRTSLAVAVMAASHATCAQGLRLTDPAGPRLQARIGMQPSLSADGAGHVGAIPSGYALGDFYFIRNRLGQNEVSGGFRATSGVLFGSRSLGLFSSGADAAATAPYLGLGWSGLSVRGGWGVAADFGVTTRPTASGLRAPGASGLDDLLRELRLTPVLHVGVSYAF